MDIASVIIDLLSDTAMLIAVLIATDILNCSTIKSKMRVVVSSIILCCLISLIFNTLFFKLPSDIQLLFVLFNYSKFFVLAVIVQQRNIVKTICTALIVQFSCSLLHSGLFLFLPSDMKILNTAMLLSTRLVILGALAIFRSKLKKTYVGNILLTIPNGVYILVLINCFLGSGLVQIADFETSSLEQKAQIIKLFALLVTVCLVCVLISLLFNVLSKKYYSDMNTLLEKQVQIQLAHYERREKINTEIRGFKHDYINHISCIKALLNSGKYTETADYLNNISASFPSDSFLYSTGNYISDAILSDKQEAAARDNTTISFNGTIPTFMNNTDLCIVLSNAVDNAIEACRGIEGEKNIEVFGGFSHGYFVLTVKNPALSSIDTAKKLPATTKKDSLYHGFGLRNIEAVVHKYSGSMKIENKDNSFILSLTFNSGTVN